jgi:TonB family protein
MEISIKKPCHENWDNMTPNEQGAFCNKCEKSVVDFSEKSIEEIKAFFTAKPNEKTCGRFTEDQMGELSFEAFFEKFKVFNFTRKMAVIIYFTFGFWLFGVSKGNAQTSSRPIVGDVAVEQTIPQKTMGAAVATHNVGDTAKCVKSPKETKTAHVKMGKVKYVPADTTKTKNKGKTKNKNLSQADTPVMKIGEAIATDNTDNTDNQVDQPKRHAPPLPVEPNYKEGREAMQSFIKKNLKYPEKAKANNIHGKVNVMFVVSKTGKLTGIKVFKGLGHGCDEEAIRIVKLMPAWNPGKKDNKEVDMEYNVNIEF